jgi:hypothetical protein
MQKVIMQKVAPVTVALPDTVNMSITKAAMHLCRGMPSELDKGMREMTSAELHNCSKRKQ